MNGGVAMFKVDIFRISKFIVGGPGEPYCKIPIKRLKLLNKFLGVAINNSKTKFCKDEDKFLFSVDKEHYLIDIHLTPIIKLQLHTSMSFLRNKISPLGEILLFSRLQIGQESVLGVVSANIKSLMIPLGRRPLTIMATFMLTRTFLVTWRTH